MEVKSNLDAMKEKMNTKVNSYEVRIHILNKEIKMKRRELDSQKEDLNSWELRCVKAEAAEKNTRRTLDQMKESNQLLIMRLEAFEEKPNQYRSEILRLTKERN